MAEFTFQKVADTSTGLPGQSKQRTIALLVTVDGEPLSFQHWNDLTLRAEMTNAANNQGHTIVSITSGIQEIKGGPFLTAKPTI